MARKKAKGKTCRPTFRISNAGHLLSVSGSSDAGRTLSTEGKRQKAKRKRRGCLNGVKKQGKSFELSAKQKRNLPPALQRAILKYHRG